MNALHSIRLMARVTPLRLARLHMAAQTVTILRSPPTAYVIARRDLAVTLIARIGLVTNQATIPLVCGLQSVDTVSPDVGVASRLLYRMAHLARVVLMAECTSANLNKIFRESVKSMPIAPFVRRRLCVSIQFFVAE